MKTVDDRPDKHKPVKHEIPKMPEGYYSGDKPNPNLKKFVEDHMREHPYDPAKDDYNVPAFNKPIETSKVTAIYNMHTYWSKKPHDAINQYIQHYTKPGDLVLDPFCGSGGTSLAALMIGRAAIAIDRSPAATFITRNYCTPVDIRELKVAFEKLKEKIKPEIDWLYETRCDKCGGIANTTSTVYSQVFQCSRCLNKIPIIDCIEVNVGKGVKGGGKGGKKRYCPICYKNGHEEQIFSKGELKLGAVPVIVSYDCENDCSQKHGERKHNDINEQKRQNFKNFDLKKIHEIEMKKIPYWSPKNIFIRGDRYHRDGLKYNNIDTVSDFYTKRNLWALACIQTEINNQPIDVRYPFLFAFSGILLGMSRMNQYRPEVSYPTSTMKGTYYIPQTSVEAHPFVNFENKLSRLFKGFEVLNATISHPKLIISTESATKLDNISSNSIDYIFTDPPYSDKVQFAELNYLWESWLGFDVNWHNEEIIINDFRNKNELEWKTMMLLSLKECYRVLKPGRWISLCYHDTSEGTWTIIQDIMAEIGYVIDNSDSVLFIDTKQKSQNQLTADKVTKRDLVINFRKPKLGEVTGTLTITGNEDSTTFSQKVTVIIREYLTSHPGSPKDRIYDEVVSRMVRAGQMEAHNFEEILGRVAEPNKPEGSTGNGLRWYLKETELNAVDSAETIKEDAAYEKIANFVTEFLKKHPENEGVHYSDLFEHYIYAVKDKPRRALVDWLLDYFYKTEEGTYRLPITEEEKRIKSEGRAKGIARRIRHYIAHLEQGVPIRDQDRPNDSTLADWLRHCRRSGMYEQGKALYEKGGIRIDRLPENQQVAVEEDYMVCVRNLARGAGKSPTTTKRKKKSDVINV
jgi:DNA modification methylase